MLIEIIDSADVVQSRLDTARELVADHTLLVKKEFSDEDTVDGIIRKLGGRPVITIDACGYASAQRVAMLVNKKEKRHLLLIIR